MAPGELPATPDPASVVPSGEMPAAAMPANVTPDSVLPVPSSPCPSLPTVEPPARPPAAASTTRSLHRLLMMRGFDPTEAANLTAFLAGIPLTSNGWTLREVNRLLFLRELARRDGWEH